MARTAPLALLSGDTFPSEMRAPRAAIAARPNLLQRFYRALIHARQLEADRAIARYLATTGGKLTDSVEREIERRLI